MVILHYTSMYQADHLCTSHLPLLIHLLICLNTTSAGPLCLPHVHQDGGITNAPEKMASATSILLAYQQLRCEHDFLSLMTRTSQLTLSQQDQAAGKLSGLIYVSNIETNHTQWPSALESLQSLWQTQNATHQQQLQWSPGRCSDLGLAHSAFVPLHFFASPGLNRDRTRRLIPDVYGMFG